MGKEIAVNQWQQRHGLEAGGGEALTGKADAARTIAEGRQAEGQGLAEAVLVTSGESRDTQEVQQGLGWTRAPVSPWRHLQRKGAEAARSPQG